MFPRANQITSYDEAGNPATTGALINSPRLGMGYTTGAGVDVQQLGSKAAKVVANAPNGIIRMNAGTLAAGASVAFVLENDIITALDNVVVNVLGGYSAIGSYDIKAEACSLGRCFIILK